MLKHHSSAHEARTLLERDHKNIEALLTRAARSVRDDTCTDAENCWNELEGALLAHLDAEEMFVIPQLASVNEADARELLNEHGQIRRTLGDIGIAFELHTVRANVIDAFCERLREHAAHEEMLLYPLVEKELGHAPLGLLLRRLQRRTEQIAAIRKAVFTLEGDDR